MHSSPLRQFINHLDSDGSLARIPVSVNPLLEMAAVIGRVCAETDGGTALLFEQANGSTFPVAANLFGSRKRVCRALGIGAMNELTAHLDTLLALIPEPDADFLDRQITALPEFTRFAPHVFEKPDPALIPMTPPDLTRFPFLQSWPDDGAAAGQPRYITLAQVITADPDGGTPNCGLYRVQLRGAREAAIQWKSGSGAARHAELYRRAGRPMPVAILLGGDPALLFSAMFPLPGDLDEVTFAGFLRGAPLTAAPCRTVPLTVPTGGEVVIEGYVEPGEIVTEGPFGNHSGYYSPAAPAPLLRVTSISHRLDAVIPATVVGPPPMEDCWMAEAWERLQLAFLRRLVPSVVDIRYPAETVFHQSAIISLENPVPAMVRNISATLWSLPWFRAARLLLFVSADAGITGLSRAAWRCINVTDAAHDIIHDSASDRIAIDATGSRLPRSPVKISAAVATLVEQRWKEYSLP